jgi:hypothetical protein
MLVGYNTNVPYKGNIYHIQTEDSGLSNPVITTLLYIKGTILSSKKISYAHIASSPDYKTRVRELMKEQHKTMMKELIRGKHPGYDPEKNPEDPPAGPRADGRTEEHSERDKDHDSKSQISKSLDDILLDFIINKGE